MKDASFTAQAVRPLPHQAMPPHILDLLEWQGRQALRPVRHAELRLMNLLRRCRIDAPIEA